MDIDEIRQAFLASDALAERIRGFRLDRLSKISSQDIPLVLHKAPRIVLHAIPISAFRGEIHLDMSSVAEQWHKLPMIYGGYSDYRLNFDGLLVSFVLNDDTTGAYAQLFRNGVIETLNSYLLEPENGLTIPAHLFEQKIFEASSSILSFLKALAIETPIYLYLSLLGVRGYAMNPGVAATFRASRAHVRAIDRDDLLLPEVLIDSYSQDLPSALKSAFDVLWNASGWPGSLYYDATGNWKP